MTLDKLNTLSERDAVTLFRQCCGSLGWSERMASGRPYRDTDHLHAEAASVWSSLPSEEWRQAFAQHPKIGDLGELRKRFPGTASWAEGEQAGVARTSDAVLESLADGNKLYEAKFGYIFIVCAAGKSAEEMLALLRLRLDNIPEEEIAVAAGEQAKITALRLEKLLHG